MEALVPHERFRYLPPPAEFTGRAGPRAVPVNLRQSLRAMRLPRAQLRAHEKSLPSAGGESFSGEEVRRFDETAAPELLPAGDGLYSRRNS